MAKKEINVKENKPSEGLQLWKIVGVFALVYAAVQIASGALETGIALFMDLINADENVRAFIGSTISRAGTIAILMLITLPVIRSVLKKPGKPTLFPFGSGQWTDILVGFAIATAAMLLIFLLEFALGFISITGFTIAGSASGDWLRALWVSLLFHLTLAITQEVLFRGLLLRGIEITWDKPGALFISAIIFGGVQILATGTNQSNWLQMVPFAALPGILLGWAILRTGNLWLATGIHFGWNLFQHDVLNLTGALHRDTLFGLQTRVNGPKWFVGSSYGIEVGAAGIVSVLLAGAGMWWWTQRKHKSPGE